MPNKPLTQEYNIYKFQLDEFTQKHLNEYVLIKKK